jgi:hypothetical protein
VSAPAGFAATRETLSHPNRTAGTDSLREPAPIGRAESTLNALGDGTEATTETRLSPIERDDRVVGAAGVVRDVTDRVEREREFRRLNERLERLAGFLTHDWPLEIDESVEAGVRATLVGGERAAER